MTGSRSIERVDLPDGVTLAPMGDLDPESGPALTRAVAEVLADPEVALVRIDLGAVDIVDSSGLRAFLDAERLCGAAGRELSIVNPGPAARRILAITGLDARLPIAGGDDAPPAGP